MSALTTPELGRHVLAAAPRDPQLRRVWLSGRRARLEGRYRVLCNADTAAEYRAWYAGYDWATRHESRFDLGLFRDPCECEEPGLHYSGVPGVVGRFPRDAERCDLCLRFRSDDEARRALAHDLRTRVERHRPFVDEERRLHARRHAGV